MSLAVGSALCSASGSDAYLRNRPDYVMWLPAGYRAPQLTWAVEWTDERDGRTVQLGAFFRVAQAEACRNQLTGEGWDKVVINMVPVHDRVDDWQWDG